MRLTNIRNRGRYINPETGKTVNIKVGRQVNRSVDITFYLLNGKRVIVDDYGFSKWVRVSH